MKYKRYLLLTLVLVLLTTTMGCGKSDLTIETGGKADENQLGSVENPVEGGQVVLPLTTLSTLNPLITENKSYYHFSKLIFESLFEFDEDLNVVGQLAESYNIKNDGRTIEIKLKDNIFWHDGEKLKSEDIAFTVNTIKYANTDNTYKKMFTDALGSYRPSDIRRIMDVSIVDDRNIIINFDREFNNNLEVLTFPIIPKHIFSKGNGNNGFIRALEAEDYNIVGTGPFKFESYEKMKEITLKANEEYRDGRPYISEVIGRILGSEEDVLTAFETGQINMATTIGVDWEKYHNNNRIKILEFVSPNYEFLGFNFSKEIFSGESGQGLRRAIAYGIDRQAIIQKVYLGHGTQTDVPIHPDSWLLSQESNSFGYDLDAAKNELKQLGWTDANSDGILEDGNGENISLSILTNSYNPMRLKMAQMIKDDLIKIGIAASIKVEDVKQDVSKEDIETQWQEVNEDLAKGDYDIALLGWELSLIPDLSFAFHSSQIPYNTNFIKYSNENMDAILEGIFIRGTREEKKNSYSELQKFIVTDLPYVSLFFKNKALLIDKKIVGELNPAFFNPYKGIEKCYIPTDLQ